jgi:uncharacterized SAM-binding protein YcdF (DUF218 family)
MRRLVFAFSLTVLGFLWAAWQVDRAGVRAQPLDWSEPTALVVLGARVEPGGVASPTLAARVAHAVEVAKAGKPAVFIVSGGVGVHGPAEAEVGLALAQQLGLAGVEMAREANSHTTHENAARTAQLLRHLHIRHVVLVSDPFHLLRARLEFERERLHVQTSPALQGPRHQNWLERAWWTSREVIALARFLVRAGWRT